MSEDSLVEDHLMSRRKQSRSGYNAGHHQSSDKILFPVFLVFGVCNTLFIAYVAVDHTMRRDEITIETSKISETLNGLKIPDSAYDCVNGRDSCKEIVQMITNLKNCERSGAVIRLMKRQMDEERQYLKMWDNIPKPFLHTEMKRPTYKDGKAQLHGWKINAENRIHCEDVDPGIGCDEGCIEVKIPGYYYIYSQVTFLCPWKISAKGQLHRHSTTRLGNSSLALMIDSYQLCGKGEEGKLKVSYHSGIYKLKENDRIMVTVEKPHTTGLFVDEDYHNDDLFFGAYLV